MLSGLTDLQTKIFRFANSVNIAKAVTSVLTDLIITVGYFLHRNCMRLQILIMKISCLDPRQWLNNCVGRKNYFTFLALMTTSLLWVCKVTVYYSTSNNSVLAKLFYLLYCSLPLKLE